MGRQYYQINNLYPFLKHPEKYAGTSKQIVCRSGWEITFAMKILDANPRVLEWSSEEIIIPYLSPIDGRVHRYFVDFWMKTDDKEYLIEVKPFAETKPPVPGKRITGKFHSEVKKFAVNQAKWIAARKFCEQVSLAGKPMEFKILTEKDLPIQT